MKGLAHIPSREDLSDAYSRLQTKNGKISLDDLVIWTQWSRLDPRLAEQLVFKISEVWAKTSSVDLNAKLRKTTWPAAFGVILEQVKLKFNEQEKFKLFRLWSEICMFSIEPAMFEQFFIGTSGLGSPRMVREASMSIKPYLKWGYLGKDILWNKQKIKSKTISSKMARLNMISEIVKVHKRITVKEYMRELNFSIHIRQAQRDLASHLRLTKIGNTKSRTYVKH